MSDTASEFSLVNPRLWANRRAHYFAVLERAMMLLREKRELPEDERHLTRELSFTSVTARRELDPDGRFERPRFESQNLADPDSEWGPPYEVKRPDIQWIHDDDAALDDRHREKSFCVECKRLGVATRSGWTLNRNYALKGVARFCTEDHQYGAHMAEGAMISFVESMDIPAILIEVNEHLKTTDIPELLPDINGIPDDTISRFSHHLIRSFPISPFQLTHLWLDIRDMRRRRAPAPKKQGMRKKSTPRK